MVSRTDNGLGVGAGHRTEVASRTLACPASRPWLGAIVACRTDQTGFWPDISVPRRFVSARRTRFTFSILGVVTR